MSRPAAWALGALLLCAARAASAADQGAAVVLTTPGRDGRGEVHIEVRDPTLRDELARGAKPDRFRVLVRTGQSRVEQVARLAAAREGVHTVLAFDQSGSFRPYLNDALALANRLLDAAPAETTATVLSFGTTLGDPRDAPSAREAQRLLASVAQSKPQLQTRLKASIREAASLASQRLPMPRGVRQVVVFTDAGEESSVYTVDQVIADARSRGVRIHTVVFGGAQQGGATLAQRRDDMKRLSEETGGYNVEVHERSVAVVGVETIARSSDAIYRLSLSFCGVPPAPPLRDDQLQVEVLRGGSLVASTSWSPFNQQAGAASRACDATCPPGTSCGPAAAPSQPPPAPPRPVVQPPAIAPWKVLAPLGAAAALAVLLAVLLRGRSKAPPAPPPAPPPPPEPPAPLLPPTAPRVDPAAASLLRGRELPPLTLLLLRSPLGSGQRLRVERSPFLLGASSDCDLQLDVGEVSSHHAAIERDADGSVYVVDVGSTNGTFVDGQRLLRGQRVPLRPGQTVALSTKVELRIELG